MHEGVVEDLVLDLLRHAIGVRSARPATLLDQGGGSSHLEGALDLVERVAVVAHDLAGLRDVPQLGGELQQRQLPSGTLWQGGHRVSSSVVGCSATSNLPRKDRVPA